MRWWLVGVLIAATACSGEASTTIDALPSTPLIDPGPTAPPSSASELAETALATIQPNETIPGQPRNFELATARVTKPDGTVCDVCVWLANSADRRARGLMHVTDLGPADGMAFLYPEPHTGRFWMKNTPMPLSIAFYAPDGAYLSAFDMEPCLTDSCVRYRTPEAFLIAVEVPQGELDALGFSAGSTLRLIDAPCVG